MILEFLADLELFKSNPVNRQSGMVVVLAYKVAILKRVWEVPLLWQVETHRVPTEGMYLTEQT